MKKEKDEEQIYLEDLDPRVQEFLWDEQKRTGESINDVFNRVMLEEGRRRYPKNGG